MEKIKKEAVTQQTEPSAPLSVQQRGSKNRDHNCYKADGNFTLMFMDLHEATL